MYKKPDELAHSFADAISAADHAEFASVRAQYLQGIDDREAERGRELEAAEKADGCSAGPSYLSVNYYYDDLGRTCAYVEYLASLTWDVAYAANESVRAIAKVMYGGQERDHAVRNLLTSGVAVRDLMVLTGLSRARIYQIRDGRR